MVWSPHKRWKCAIVLHQRRDAQQVLTELSGWLLYEQMTVVSYTRLLSENWQGQSNPKAVGGDGQSAPVQEPVHFIRPEQPFLYARKRDKNIYHSTKVVVDVLDLNFPAMAVNATLLIYQPDSVEQNMFSFTTNF
jgi:hypothetical protein